MARIQFSLIGKIKIGRPEQSLTPHPPYVRYYLIFDLPPPTPTPLKVDVICVSSLTAKELEKVQEDLKVAREEKKKQTVCAEKHKQEIAKYATISGVTAAIRKFQPKFPNLAKVIVRPWKIHKKSKKIHTGAEEEGRNQCAIDNWKS